MTATVEILSPTSTEKIRVEITAPSSPTASDVEFQLRPLVTRRLPSVTSEYPVALGWVDGSWSGSYAAGVANALTPFVIGGLGGAAGTYWLWGRWTVGTETPERLCGIVQIGGNL